MERIAAIFHKLLKKPISSQRNIITKKVTVFNHILPQNVWKHILSFLSPTSIVAIACTCEFMHHQSEDPRIWIPSLAHLFTIFSLPSQFPSWSSFWSFRMKANWKYFADQSKIIGVDQLVYKGRSDTISCVVLGNCIPGVCPPAGSIFDGCIDESFITLLSLPIQLSLTTSSTSSTSSSPSSNTSIAQLSESNPIYSKTWVTNGFFSGGRGSFAHTFLCNASAAMFIFSVALRKSFVAVDTWQSIVEKRKTPTLLVGLVPLSNSREVDQAEAKKYAHEHGMAYIEIHAHCQDMSTHLSFLFFSYVGLHVVPPALLALLTV